MSKQCLRLFVVGFVVILAWSVASADWTITEPNAPTTYHHDDDVDTHGISTSHPTARDVNFGYVDAMGKHAERTVTVNTQDVGGAYEWDQTLLAPTNGWQLSPTGPMGIPTPDHVVWVYSTSTNSTDDEVGGHTVVQ